MKPEDVTAEEIKVIFLQLVLTGGVMIKIYKSKTNLSDV